MVKRVQEQSQTEYLKKTIRLQNTVGIDDRQILQDIEGTT